MHPLCPDLFKWDFQSVIKLKCIGKLWATVHGPLHWGDEVIITSKVCIKPSSGAEYSVSLFFDTKLR